MYAISSLQITAFRDSYIYLLHVFTSNYDVLKDLFKQNFIEMKSLLFPPFMIGGWGSLFIDKYN